VAAPVTLCRERLPSAEVRAVLVNAGNANACTGDAGIEDAARLCTAVAAALDVAPEAVLPCSTGVIGLPLPVERMVAAVPALSATLGVDPEPFARCILTTDTCTKLSARSVSRGDHEIRVLGVAKGSGMIRPDMATMLGFLVADAPAGPELLQQVLGRAVERTFNRITVDGDTSTNDTVLALASGAAGGTPLEEDPGAREAFAATVEAVCRDLARMIVRDGEGAGKLVDVWVRGAVDEAAAERAARTIAESPLVKTALHGEDPNWGRIAAALGRSCAYAGGPFAIAVGGVEIVIDGHGLGAVAEAAAHRVMQRDEFTIEVRLDEGSGEACVTTCDFSAAYVSINADYRS
jgi:glutamate N-acetyltransferase/amino-acid N-acetyltransferase